MKIKPTVALLSALSIILSACQSVPIQTDSDSEEVQICAKLTKLEVDVRLYKATGTSKETLKTAIRRDAVQKIVTNHERRRQALIVAMLMDSVVDHVYGGKPGRAADACSKQHWPTMAAAFTIGRESATK